MTMRGNLRDLAARAGLEVTRTGRGPRRTLAEVLGNARRAGLQAASVIDVGVARGTPGLYEAFPGAELLLVEPLAEWEGYCREIVAGGRGRYVIAAAGAGAGELSMRVHRVPELSSVVGERDPGQSHERTVPVVRLDDEAASLPGPVVVKADVEGAELDVLAGARQTLRRTELVLLETSLFELVPGQPLLHDVIGWMAGAGFVVYDVFGGHQRPLDGALAQLDIAFARRDGVLRTDQRYGTERQADALYRSWGR